MDNRLDKYLLDFSLVERRTNVELPIAFRPKRINPRIRAQKGMFTIHGNNKNSLEDIFNNIQEKKENIIFEKIIIDGNQKLTILKQLFTSGITYSSFFPERDGICRDLSFRYSKEFTEKESSHRFFGF